jgi:hypothetical protein
LTEGKVSIESVGKSAVLKTPGDVTVGGHQWFTSVELS